MGPPCLIVGVVFLCHTLPCAQQQPQHRERLETFDDVIRSSLEVTGRGGRRVCVMKGSVFGPGFVCETQMYLQCLCIQYSTLLVCLCIESAS